MSTITRMSMGQKASAKNCAKVAFSEDDGPGEKLNTPSHPSEQKDNVDPGQGHRDSLKLTNASSTSHNTEGNKESKVHPDPEEGDLRDVARLTERSGPSVAEPRDIPEEEGEDDDDNARRLKQLDTRIDALRAQQESQEEAWLRRFNVTMGAVIVLNIVVIAIETDAVDEHAAIADKIAWIIIDSLFILIFLFEVVVRMWLERKAWVLSCWNWFDIIIIIIACIDLWIITFIQSDEAEGLYVLSIFRIVRLVRLVRLVKLVRLLHGLYVILSAFWAALQTMSFLLALMLFGLMIYAIFAVNLLGRNTSLRNVRINGDTVYDRFGTVYRSMYSLFELMTLEGWEQVARPIVTEMPIAFLFIVSFIMIFTFGMLNMVVALVIEKTLHHTRMMSEHALQTERLRMADELMRIKTLFSSGKKAGAGKITFEEFQVALKESDAVKKIFENMGTTANDARDLFMVLDWDESGDLTVKEFLEGLQRLQDGVASPWDSLATHAIVRNIKGQSARLHDRVSRMSSEEEQWRAKMEQRMDAQDKCLQEILNRLKNRPNTAP